MITTQDYISIGVGVGTIVASVAGPWLIDFIKYQPYQDSFKSLNGIFKGTVTQGQKIDRITVKLKTH